MSFYQYSLPDTAHCDQYAIDELLPPEILDLASWTPDYPDESLSGGWTLLSGQRSPNFPKFVRIFRQALDFREVCPDNW